MTAYLMTAEQHAQIVDALNRVDAVNRGMVTTNAHIYAARDETTEALAMLKAMKPLRPLGYLCDWGDDSYGLTRQTFYYGEPGSASEDDWNEYPKVHKNLPLYALGDTA